MQKRQKFILTVFLILGMTVFSQEITENDTTSNEIKKAEITANVQLALSEPNYPVTIGDVYLLNFSANGKAIQYSILVDSSYKLRIANLAVLDAKGKTYIQLKKQAEEIVQKNFPMSGVQFILTNPGTFKVPITGEVLHAAEVKLWSLARLSQAISGLLTPYSSVRNIQIISETGKITVCDLFKASRNGDFSQDPYLKPGDKIIISRAERKVSISGEVERSGTYELLKGENLQALISYYAHGLKTQADTSRIEISKITGTTSLTGEKKYLTKEEAEKDFQLDDLDNVHIPSYQELQPVIFIEGAIHSTETQNLDTSTKVSIRFSPGTRYSSFLRNHASWFSATADIKNAYIIRNETTIPIDISKYLYDYNTTSDIILNEFDTLIIPYKQFFVTVSGSVLKPGRYPYIPDRTYDYYISLAGGILEEKNSNSSVKITDMNGKILSKSDFITPESNIYAKTNSFTYYFSKYAPVVTTILSLVTTTLTIIQVSK